MICLLPCVLLLVTASQAQVELSILDSGEMSSGKAFSLTCLVQGSYSSKDPYVWRKNYEILPGKTENVLEFAALEKSDIGLYDCGYDDSGTMFYSLPFPLTFSYRPVVHISVRVDDHNDSSVPAGYDVYLTCNVTDSRPEVPADNYRWWYAKTCQDKVWALLKLLTNETFVFKLPSVKVTDEGCYRCMANNADNLNNNATKMLHVSYLDYPCISLDPAVMEGDSTKVNCSVNSSPNTTLTLYKNGSLLRRVKGEGLLTYPISKVTLEHQGAYTCEASNAVISPNKSVTTQFKIQHKPVAIGNISSHHIVVKSPRGSSVDLLVEFQANPQPTVEWRRVSPDRVALDGAITAHNSSVLTVRVEDTPAVFCVRIFNQYGELSRQFEVEGVADTGTTPPAVSGETTTSAPEETTAVGLNAWSSDQVTGLAVGIFILGLAVGAAGVLGWYLKKDDRNPATEEDAQVMHRLNPPSDNQRNNHID